MGSSVENTDVILSVIYTLLAFFVLLVTIAIFMYLSKKKIVEREIDLQKEVLNAIITTQEQERSRISRDLHDDISSKLNAVSMNVYLLGQSDLAAAERTEVAENTFKACRSVIESTRRISHNLMPLILENIGLHLAIEEISREFSASESLKVLYENFYKQEFFTGFTKEKEVHVFRIVQELITNSIKHSGASEIVIRFKEAKGVKSMIYTDNGKGITSSQLSYNKGIGLKNIFSRAGIINSNPSIDTKYDKGFYFTLTF